MSLRGNPTGTPHEDRIINAADATETAATALSSADLEGPADGSPITADGINLLG